MLMSRPFNVDGIRMPLWGIAWLACLQKWEPRGCLDSVQLNAIWKCDLPWRMCHVQGHAEEALKHFDWMCEEDYSQMMSFVFC